MDLSLIKEFSMVAKYGNLSEAARELHTTQSALSRHLSIIEKEFGARMFDRQKNPMELTPAGEFFLDKSKVLLNEYQRLVVHFRGVNEGSFDSVAVSGLIDSSASALFFKAKRLMNEERPYLVVKVVEATGQTPFDSLRNGLIDLAIEPMSGMVDLQGLASLRLVSERPFVIMEESHPCARRQSLETNDIAALSFTSLRSNKDHALRKHIQDKCRLHGIEGARPRGLALSPANSYAELMLLGLGEDALMVPESMAKRYVAKDDPIYRTVPVEDVSWSYDIRAFYVEHPLDKTKRLLDCLIRIA